jgi:hypothetical protein
VPTTGYTQAASVDTSRMPVPPQSSTTVNLTGPITISSTVTDVTYNVIAPINGAAVTLTSTGRLERVVVRANGLAVDGVAGGTVKDGAVYDSTYAGFINVKQYEGANLGQRNYIDFYLGGSGINLLANAMLKSYDTSNFGFMGEHLFDSNFAGALVSLKGGQSNRNASATGFACWNDCQRNTFNIIIANSMPGYGMEMLGGSAFNTVKEFSGDGSGTFDSDPGISFQGGAHNNVIASATVTSYAEGAIFGEDIDPSVYNNRIDTLRVADAPVAGVIFDRGSNNNLLGSTGGVTLVNCGTIDPYRGALQIANRVGQTNAQPHDNKIVGLNESGTLRVPNYSVFLGSGTTRNAVSGNAFSWWVAKLLDQGVANTISVG